jgi:hypothetical protein
MSTRGVPNGPNPPAGALGDEGFVAYTLTGSEQGRSTGGTEVDGAGGSG